MKIFTAQQIYDADKFTIEHQGIESNELMERAAVQIFNWIHLRMQGAQVKIHLFCGIGNNGGDGIALARHLQEHGYNIAVYVVNYSEKRSKDFLINLDRLKDRKLWPDFLTEESSHPPIGKDDIIVDAIFGIGLNRPPSPWVKQLIQYLNGTAAFILSIDVPSGLFLHKWCEPDCVIQSNYVLSFQAPKMIFFLPQTGVYINQWEILDIGLDMGYLASLPTSYELISKNEVLPWYMPREKYSHKGTYGHALVVGGSFGKMGAVILSCNGALKAGAGLVTAYVPECGCIPLQSSLPEAMVLADSQKQVLSKIAYDIVPIVVGMGIGMGTDTLTQKAFKDFLRKNKTPLVLDADALNMLALEPDLLKKLPPQSILTPHRKELERLIGTWSDDFDMISKTKAFSALNDCIIVVKGAHTITFYKEVGYVNTTGNPGMATAGSGDVLMGIILGLRAQGYPPLEAAIFGVYLHGRAGDLAVEQSGYQALLASDIVSYLGNAFIDLFKVPESAAPKEEEK